MKKKIFIYTIIMIFAAGGAFAAPADQPKTGQKICYDASNVPTGCLGTGQDGEKQTGITWPVPRFTNPDGTAPITGSVVMDQHTGLMWLRDANCIVTNYPSFDEDGTLRDGAVTWQRALDFVAGINAGTYPNCKGGYNDWRLPNVNDLESMVHGGYTEETCSGSPCTTNAAWLNTKGFNNIVQANFYWSSTAYASDTLRAWSVSIYHGNVFIGYKFDTYYVWPVRGGQ